MKKTIFILIIVGLGFLFGIKKGFIKQLATLLGYVIGSNSEKDDEFIIVSLDTIICLSLFSLLFV